MYDAPLTAPTTLLALVLIVSGVAKIADLRTAGEAFVSLRLPPVLMRLRAPQALPFAELVLALLMLTTSGPVAVLVAAATWLLFVAYLVVIVRALGFDEPVTCSCFGRLGLGSVDRFTAVRNLLLVALATVGLYDATRGRSVLARILDFSGGEWLWFAGVLTAVALTWLVTGPRASSPPAPATRGDEGDDYLRTPIPFASLRTPTDEAVTLRDLARTAPVMLLLVSPTCGSCTRVIEAARTWQHSVAHLRTVLVLPTAVRDDGAGLPSHEDFDLLFDPRFDVGRIFEGSTPTAVLLGADGLLAGGPVVGSQAILPFLDDVAAELGAVGAAAPADALDAPTTAPSDDAPSDGNGDRGARTNEPAPEDDVALLPTPFALFTDGEGRTVSLRDIGASGPAVLLHVSPGCGSCHRTMDTAPAWEARLRGVAVHFVVPGTGPVSPLLDRGLGAGRVLFDEQRAVARMMGIGTPAMFAVGPTQHLLAGPVSGHDAIVETMEEIIAEVALVRPDHAGGAVAAADGEAATTSG